MNNFLQRYIVNEHLRVLVCKGTFVKRCALHCCSLFPIVLIDFWCPQLLHLTETLVKCVGVCLGGPKGNRYASLELMMRLILAEGMVTYLLGNRLFSGTDYCPDPDLACL